MLQGVRKHIETLIGRRTDHRAPAFKDAAAAPALGRLLKQWHADAGERYARLFLHAKPLLVARRERELFDALQGHGLVERLGPSIFQPCVRLFPLYGRFIATDLLSRREPDQVFSLMFEQVYLVRNMDVQPDDDVLELCLGSGVNSLFAADTARSVTAVDLNPRALAFAQFNELLNAGDVELDLKQGSLFEPIDDGTAFDVILVNPPFELVPKEETWFLHSDGGEDGLDVVRNILAEAPSYLQPGGRFQIITWSPGTASGPVLVDLMREAFPRHRLHVHILDVAPLDQHLGPFRKSPHYDAWRARLAQRGLTDVYFLFVHAAPASTAGVEVTNPESEVAACDAISDPWT